MSAQEERQWQQWRAERMEDLRDPHGWLSLVSLEKLGSQPAQLESFPGLWSADGQRVTVQFTKDDGVTRDGAPVAGEFVLEIPPGESDATLTDASDRVAEVASRLGSIVVRVRDPRAETLTGFSQTNTYPFDPQWVINGPWEPFPEPVSVPIVSVYKNTPTTSSAIGKTTLLGQEVLVGGHDAESLHLIFHDETNGDTTEGWRSAPVVVQGDQVTVDFNRAVNFPAHFTPFGTCPMPPEGNTFTARITAGERKNT